LSLFAFWRVANNVDGLILSTYAQDRLILLTAHPSYAPLWYELIRGEPYSRNIRTAPPPPPKKSFHPPSSRHATATSRPVQRSRVRPKGPHNFIPVNHGHTHSRPHAGRTKTHRRQH